MAAYCHGSKAIKPVQKITGIEKNCNRSGIAEFQTMNNKIILLVGSYTTSTGNKTLP